MNESFIKMSRMFVKSQADPGLELWKALPELSQPCEQPCQRENIYIPVLEHKYISHLH